jgi:hypothetical protein
MMEPALALKDIIPGCLTGPYAQLARLAIGLLRHAEQEYTGDVRRHGNTQLVRNGQNVYCREAVYEQSVVPGLHSKHTVERVSAFGKNDRLSVAIAPNGYWPDALGMPMQPVTITAHDIRVRQLGVPISVPGYGLVVQSFERQPTVSEYVAQIKALEAFIDRGEYLVNSKAISELTPAELLQ